MSTFLLLNFGCRASQADGAAIKRQLIEGGLQEVQDVTQSQVAILNTCTVTARADAEVRQLIRRLQRANPLCRILVTGCYAQRAPAEVAEQPAVSPGWVGNSHKHVLAELLRSSLQAGDREAETEPADRQPRAGGETDPGRSPLVQIQPSPAVAIASPTAAVSRSKAGRPLAPEIPSISWWARLPINFTLLLCSRTTAPVPRSKFRMAVTRVARSARSPPSAGAAEALPRRKLVEQVRELEQNGYKEIVLSGINLGSYGRDISRRITFLRLLERLLAETEHHALAYQFH